VELEFSIFFRKFLLNQSIN